MTAKPKIFSIDELDEFCLWWWGSDNDERTVTDVIESGSMTAFAEACIARWGNYPEFPDSSTQPIPVSERLPAAQDCDAEGRCWFHSVGRTWKDWYLLQAASATETETHWLPANALPLPS